MSCIGYCTSPASRFVDFHLKSIINKATTSTVLADTNSLVSLLASTNFPTNSKLVTADVVSLYTNMCWHDTIATIDQLLSEIDHNPPPPPRSLRHLLVDLITFVLENIYFNFEDSIYHQVQGMAKGTPMAVNVASAFLFIHERKTLSLFKESMYLFTRFIDEVFLVMDENLCLENVKLSVYSDLVYINLTWTVPRHECIFLDLEIHRSITDKACILMYRTHQNLGMRISIYHSSRTTLDQIPVHLFWLNFTATIEPILC